MNPRRALLCILLASYAMSAPAERATFNSVHVILGEPLNSLHQKYAELLRERISESGVATTIDQAAGKGLSIYLGVPAKDNVLGDLCGKAHIKPLDVKDPGEEGFVLKSISSQGPGDTLIAAGVDDRGVLYAIGEILRRIDCRSSRATLDIDIDVRSAPAFPIRGTMVSQGATMRDLTKARVWTRQEWERVVLDYALAGLNNLAIGYGSPADRDDYEFLKSYGLKTLIAVGPNTGSGPPEWEAVEAIGRKGYLCLSVPEARASLLKALEQAMQNCPDYDYVRFYSGDGGGCECDRCAPYGAMYIHMCEEMAKIILRYHPKISFFATNQKLDNAGDFAIFEYLQTEPRPWLTALCYGPGSNAMGWMPGRRQDHRMDLFHYPRFGQMDGYLREIVHQLPPQQDLVFYTDLTHWVYSQYGLMDHELIPDRDHDTPPANDLELYSHKPDSALAAVYNRRTFHARPKAYYRIFQETMRYGIGDSTYSEGHHDHINQWMWQRLLWNPKRSLEDVVGEYASVCFGAEATTTMVQAILQAEENLSTPILTNTGIDRFNTLIDEAAKQMSPEVMEKSYLWRQYAQKGLLDKYIQLRVMRQQQRQQAVEQLFSDALSNGETARAVKESKALLEQEIESDEMRQLKDRARILGEESDKLFGVNNEGLFNLDQDFVGLGWITHQLDVAANVELDTMKGIVHQIVHYEDAGRGGFYDAAGLPDKAPHMTHGWRYGEGGFSDINRASQKSCAYTTDQQRGVTFEYDGLDPQAQYTVKFTLVRPVFLPRFADKQPQKTESIFADGACLAKNLELPESVSQFFTYEIPREATADGRLSIWFEKSEGAGEGPRPKVTVWRNTGGWGTLVSEVWLMKSN